MSMLSGMNSTAGAMFPGLGAPEKSGPSPQEMEEARQMILCKKNVTVSSYNVKVFDMHESKDRAAYQKLMIDLIQGVQAATHVIWHNDRQLVTRDGKQGWMRYIEWSEYELHEEPTPAVGGETAKGEQ